MREGRAALIGFGLGLVLLVPIGVVMSGRVSDVPQQKPESSAPIEAQIVPTVARLEPAHAPSPTPPASATFTASLEAIAPPTRSASTPDSFIAAPAPVTPAPEPPKINALEVSLNEARSMIGSGEIDSARAMLKSLGAEHEPAVMMLLAETYDPNMLAAWSARGTVADVATARAFYQRALALGLGQARQRLQALD